MRRFRHFLLQMTPALALALASLVFAGCTRRAPAEEPRAPLAAEKARETALPPSHEGPGTPQANVADPAEEVELRFPRSKTVWLGVELRATKAPNPGVEITRVLPRSPAARAKLQAGDILLSLGGTPVMTPEAVSEWVRAQRPGTSEPFTLLRNGKSRLVRAELEGQPDPEDRMRLSFVGDLAPEISGVTTFQGEAASLKDLRGQVVVLEFWGSFCQVCRVIAPTLETWQRTYQPQGVEVVGITVDPPVIGQQTAGRVGMTYTLASDPAGTITRKYMASQIPVVVIIDRRGIVRDAMVGYSKARLQETEALIQKLLSESVDG